MSFKTEIDRGEERIGVLVEYDYTPGQRGERDSYGAPLEPDEAPDIEIESVIPEDGGQCILEELSEETIQELQVKALAEIEEARTEAAVLRHESNW